MSNFDQFFKDKFQDREFEFKEAYWKQAQELIQEDQQERRRGLWYWMLGGSILLLALIVTSAVCYFGVNGDPVSENKTTIFENNIEAAAKATSPGSGTLAIDANEKIFNEIKTNQAQTKNPSIVNNQKGNEIPSGSTNSSETNDGTKIDNKNEVSAQEAVTKNSKGQNLQNNQDQAISRKGSTIPPSEIASGASENKNANTSAVTKGSTSETARESIPNTATPANRSAITELTTLESLAPDLLATPEKDLPECRDLFNGKIKRWHWGITANTHFYPAQTSEQIWIGGAAGPSVQYKINPRISIQADLLYAIRTGNFGDTKSVSQNTYSFGLREKVATVETSSLHFLELPLFFQYTNGRQIVEGGLGLKYLLATRGTLTERTSLYPWERRGSSADPTSGMEENNITTGNLVTDSFNKLIPSVLLGYRYRISTNVTANFQVKYNLSPLVNTTNEGVLREDGPLRISLGVTCFPFRKMRNN